MKQRIIKSLSFLILLFFTLHIYSQENPLKHTSHRKGKLYFYWGWNGSFYTKSDIKFKGSNYNFELKNVKATDRQNKFDIDKYFNPANITIPQYNFRIGYYFKDKWDISFGIDHMKYVVKQLQRVKITGFINDSNTPFDGIYDHNDITIQEGFLEFEHTDGLNFVNIELRRSEEILRVNDNLQLNVTAGFGAGVLYPKTNTALLNKSRYDQFNVAGYGIDAILGLNVTFLKRFFIQTEFKTGFIDLPNIRTTASSSDSAKQNFFFFQRNIVFGGIFNLSKASKIRKI